jgi:hypothetical protein
MAGSWLTNSIICTWLEAFTSSYAIKHSRVISHMKSKPVWTFRRHLSPSEWGFNRHTICTNTTHTSDHDDRDIYTLRNAWHSRISTSVVTRLLAGRTERRDSIPGWIKRFSLLHRVQTGFGFHLAFSTSGTRNCFAKSVASGAWNWPLCSIQYRI